LLKLFIGHPMPIIFALMLNEVRHLRAKKIFQTVSYMKYVSRIPRSGCCSSRSIRTSSTMCWRRYRRWPWCRVRTGSPMSF
jgi:hypothetical protein